MTQRSFAAAIRGRSASAQLNNTPAAWWQYVDAADAVLQWDTNTRQAFGRLIIHREGKLQAHL